MPIQKTPELMAFRCTFFLNTLVDVQKVKEIFTIVANGAAPTVVNEQMPLTVAHGQNGPNASVVVCQSLPGRLDFIWNSVKNNLPPTLSEYTNENMCIFINTLNESIFNEMPNISRIAISGDVIYRVENNESGYNVMKNMISNIKNLEYPKNKDFIYRINIPTSLEMNNKTVEVNRVYQWMTAEAYAVLNDAPMSIPQSCFVGINFDINTGQNDNIDLSGKDAIKELYNLTKYVDDVVSHGDQLEC